MILNAEVNNDGILEIMTPKPLWGKKVVVSISEKTDRILQQESTDAEIHNRELHELLKEGYQAVRQEDSDITEEFQFADSEGWDEVAV